MDPEVVREHAELRSMVDPDQAQDLDLERLPVLPQSAVPSWSVVAVQYPLQADPTWGQCLHQGFAMSAAR